MDNILLIISASGNSNVFFYQSKANIHVLFFHPVQTVYSLMPDFKNQPLVLSKCASSFNLPLSFPSRSCSEMLELLELALASKL